MYYYPRRFRVIGFCRILFILANEMRVMGLISPIDKNARDIHSTTHVLASWRIFPVQAFFSFFLISMLFAFCIWRFCSFPYSCRLGYLRVCKARWLRSENAKYVITMKRTP